MKTYKFRFWNHDNKTMSETYTLMDDLSWYQDEAPCYDVMQFTGLLDKNGKSIFEGDIVKSHDNHFPGVVRFGKGTYDSGVYEYQGFYVEAWNEIYIGNKWEKNGIDSDATGAWLFDCEVIGNIYEDKELLDSQ